MRKLSKSLTGAFSEILILSLLKQKPGYGYEIIKILEEITKGRINRQPGSIYPHMNKMENKGWIKSDWDIHTERPRRIYHILDKGIKELEIQKEEYTFLKIVLEKFYE